MFPAQRHDGSAWAATDARRRRLVGPLGLRSALIRATGDWQAYKELLGFPQYNEVKGIRGL